MAVPAEKNIENKRYIEPEKLKSPEISFDENLGDYRKSHHIFKRLLWWKKSDG